MKKLIIAFSLLLPLNSFSMDYTQECYSEYRTESNEVLFTGYGSGWKWIASQNALSDCTQWVEDTVEVNGFALDKSKCAISSCHFISLEP